MTRPTSNWTGVAFGLTLACFAAYQQFKLPPAMPLMLERYGYDRTLAGAFMSIYAAAGLFLSLALGRLIEHRGSGGPVAAALGLMTLGTVATLLWPESGWVVLASRGLEGGAFAVLAIAGPVLANANASPRHLPAVIALTAAWIPIGQLAGVLVAQLGFGRFGWPVLWWLGLGFIAALAVWLAALWRSGRVALGRPAAPQDRAAPRPPESVSPAQRLSLALAAAVFMLWSGQYFAYMTWLPQYLVEALGLSMAGALVGYTLPIGMLLVSIMATGQAMNRGVPVGPLMVGALVVQTATWAVLPAVGADALGVAALLLYGAGAGVVPTCLFAMPSAIAGHGRAAATAFGIIMTGRNLGVLAGPVVLAQVFALAGGWDWSAPLLGAVTALALVLGIWLARRIAGAAYGTRR